MVLEKLGTSLKSTLKKIAGSIFVDKSLIDEIVKDIQRALLSADVNVQLVFDLSKKIKERALDEKLPKGINQREHLVNIIYEELVIFLGEKKEIIKLNEKHKPAKLMLVGLFGSGKTTTAGKLANYYKKRGKRIALLQLDTWRPAAKEQLEQLGTQLKVDTYTSKEKNPLKIWNEYKNKFGKYDLLIIDTAGRDALNRELIDEIEKINNLIVPDETLLVISADIGQAAKQQAEQFYKSCKVTGVIVTKLDGTARGGGALTACATTKAPVKLVGTGEKLDDLEQFNPKGFVGRLLGMGDLEALLEKTKEAISEEQAEDLGKKVLKGEFNFLDLYEQMKTMSKMGPLTKVMEMIPGLGSAIPKDMLNVQEDKLKRWKHIMQSMTKKELEDPEIITGSRIERIAKGAGVNTSEVRELIKQYKMTKKMMKMMKGKDPSKLMKKFKGKIPGL